MADDKVPSIADARLILEVRADANFYEPGLVQISTDAISEEFNGSGIGRDGPDLVYPLGPGSHTFTVLHSPANF